MIKAAEHHETVPLHEPEAHQAHGDAQRDLPHEGRRKQQSERHDEDHHPHQPHGRAGCPETSCAGGRIAPAGEKPAWPAPPPVPHRRWRWSAAAARPAARASAADDDLNRHQRQQQAADQRDGRRHRQAVRKPSSTMRTAKARSCRTAMMSRTVRRSPGCEARAASIWEVRAADNKEARQVRGRSTKRPLYPS